MARVKTALCHSVGTQRAADADLVDSGMAFAEKVILVRNVVSAGSQALEKLVSLGARGKASDLALSLNLCPHRGMCDDASFDDDRQLVTRGGQEDELAGEGCELA
jgi:hypothetical protein